MSASARKVLHVSDSDEWSGGGAQLLGLARGIKDRGWQSLIACRPGSGLSKAAQESGLPVFHSALRQDYDLISAWRLARFIAAEKISVVHSHHSRSHGVCLLAKFFLSLSNQEGVAPVLVVSRRVSFAVGKNPFSLWKYRSGLIDSFIAVADAVKDVLVSCGVDARRVAVIYSGVNVKKFSPRPADPALLKELKIPPGAALIGKIANFSPWKGQAAFLEAAAVLIAKKRPVHFLLAGRDTDGPWVRAEVARLGLENHVTLAGFRSDIPDVLPCLSVSVNAAIKGEGLSGALRESLCMGIPIVASDIAGNRELLSKSGAPFLFPAGQANVLAERIEWVLDHPQEAKAVVEDWRRRVSADFSIEQTIEKTAALYLRLTGGER